MRMSEDVLGEDVLGEVVLTSDLFVDLVLVESPPSLKGVSR